MAEQVAEVRRRILGRNTRTRPRASATWLACTDLMGDYAKAEPLFRQALEDHRGKPWEQSPANGPSCLNNLALLYMSMGDYAKAETLFGEALETRTKVLEEYKTRTPPEPQQPGFAVQLDGDSARAEPLYR